ncbi:hypothetical protein CJU89_6064 [Yarrowia sp. B02]|nr:hypothetical protein CJU89_6064 [Yarrowia sp. B02]
MEFDRSQIFAPVQADTVPRFAQRPRPAAPGLLDQLPSTNIGRTKNNDRLRVLVRGVPDHVTQEEVEQHLIRPFSDIVDSWYLVRQDFVADLDLDLDLEASSNTRVYVQLHSRDDVQKFHASVNGDFEIAKNFPCAKSDSETISDKIPTPLQVEYSPLSYFTPNPVTTEIMAGTIESDPLYIKFCENPDQLLFEGGEGRVLEPVIAPTEFEMGSIVPVGVPLAKIDIPEDERVTLPEEKKKAKKAKKAKDKKEKNPDTKDTKKESSEPTTREGTPTEDKKKKRSRKKKPAAELSSQTTPNIASANTTPTSPPTAPSTSTDATAKPKPKKKKSPKESRDSPSPSPFQRDSSRDSRESTPRETQPRDPQAPKKQKKKTDNKPKNPKSDAKSDVKPDPKPKQQPGKETQPKPKPKPQQQSQTAVSIPQTTGQATGATDSGEKSAPKKKRTRSKKPTANGTSAASASAPTQ